MQMYVLYNSYINQYALGHVYTRSTFLAKHSVDAVDTGKAVLWPVLAYSTPIPKQNKLYWQKHSFAFTLGACAATAMSARDHTSSYPCW